MSHLVNICWLWIVLICSVMFSCFGKLFVAFLASVHHNLSFLQMLDHHCDCRSKVMVTWSIIKVLRPWGRVYSVCSSLWLIAEWTFSDITLAEMLSQWRQWTLPLDISPRIASICITCTVLSWNLRSLFALTWFPSGVMSWKGLAHRLQESSAGSAWGTEDESTLKTAKYEGLWRCIQTLPISAVTHPVIIMKYPASLNRQDGTFWSEHWPKNKHKVSQVTAQFWPYFH